MTNTRDFTKFGHRERKIAADLLQALHTGNDKTKFLGDNVAVEFNPMSGCVFLVDEDYNVAMMNGEDLEDFITCPECGTEDLESEMVDAASESCCVDYLTELGLLEEQDEDEE